MKASDSIDLQPKLSAGLILDSVITDNPDEQFLKKYSFGKSVGVGCLGQVFEATRVEPCEDESPSLVIKVVNKNSDAAAAAFRNERDILQTLPPNPSTVRLVDSYENEFRTWLVMEKAGDLTLERFVKQSEGGVSIDLI